MRVRLRGCIPILNGGNAQPQFRPGPTFSLRRDGIGGPSPFNNFSTLNPSNFPRSITDLFRSSRHLADVKPGRILGAPWMDDLIEQRQILSLCEDCTRKYGWKSWCSKQNYLPRWDPKPLTDCDGCGSDLIFCTNFWPAEHPSISHFNYRTQGV